MGRLLRPFVLGLVLWPCMAAAAEGLDGGELFGVQVVKAGELGRGPDYLTATVTLTSLYEGKEPEVIRERVMRHKGRSRVDRLRRGELQEGEPTEGIQDRFEDFAVHDYAGGETFRPLRGENLAFAYRLSMAEQIGAQVRGYMRIPSEELVWRVVLRRDAEFRGHPCTLALVGYSAMGQVFSLRWVWEASDLDGQPVKVVFPQGDGGILIVEYEQVSDAPFGPDQLELPEDMPVMTGF